MSQQPFDCNRLASGWAGSNILSDSMMRKLDELFRVCSNMSVRMFLVGSLLLIMARSVVPEMLSFETRLRSFSLRTQLDSNSLKLTRCWAENGFHSNGSQGAVCCHCGARVDRQTMSNERPEQWHGHSNHGHSNCTLFNLLRILSDSSVRISETTTTAFTGIIDRLSTALKSPMASFVESFGFSRDHVALAFLILMLRNRLSISQLRPGELIRVIHGLPSVMPLSVAHLLRLVTEGSSRQVRDNAPPPNESRGDEIGSRPEPQRPQNGSSKQRRPATGGTAEHSLIERRISSQSQQPVDPIVPGDSPKCMVCRLRSRNRVILPCAHLVACHVCVEGLRRCPSCRQSLLATIIAFIT